MALVFQVLSPHDLDEVFGFANQRLAEAVPDETDRAFRSWEAKWRRESLEHYLKLGWSFIAREDGKIRGFFLGQPFMFFRGQTQTLWIEHIEASDEATRAALVEVAVKVAREKHLQRVLFADAAANSAALKAWPAVAFADAIAEVKTTKG